MWAISRGRETERELWGNAHIPADLQHSFDKHHWSAAGQIGLKTLHPHAAVNDTAVKDPKQVEAAPQERGWLGHGWNDALVMAAFVGSLIAFRYLRK